MEAGKQRASETTTRCAISSLLCMEFNLLLLQAAISMLKHEYKVTPTLDDALQLAIKVLNKTLDSTKLSAEKGRSGMLHTS